MMHILLTGKYRNPLEEKVSEDTPICAGFGDAIVYRDGEEVYSESASDSDDLEEHYWTISDAEKYAQENPGSYIAWIYTPLWSAIYQRRENGWYTVYAGMGFADDENAEKDLDALHRFLNSQ